jgi:hypothetical protein
VVEKLKAIVKNYGKFKPRANIYVSVAHFFKRSCKLCVFTYSQVSACMHWKFWCIVSAEKIVFCFSFVPVAGYVFAVQGGASCGSHNRARSVRRCLDSKSYKSSNKWHMICLPKDKLQYELIDLKIK